MENCSVREALAERSESHKQKQITEKEDKSQTKYLVYQLWHKSYQMEFPGILVMTQKLVGHQSDLVVWLCAEAAICQGHSRRHKCSPGFREIFWSFLVNIRLRHRGSGQRLEET